ncbi:MAG: hypothetical protein C0392_04055 [Syntrophus sp. (in: bacteria)]|nr:hypothetical protein [Syntrophus sp. (in: bacteria)]
MIRIVKDTTSYAAAISRVAIDSFMLAVAPVFHPQGIAEFIVYACPVSIAGRMALGNSFYMALDGNAIIGMAELIHPNHLAMLFIAKERQRQGIGRMLVSSIREDILADHGAFPIITVDAAPNSVGAYERFRFTYRGSLRELNGVRFFPMSLTLTGAAVA